MRKNFEWKVKRSNKTTLHLVCLLDNCMWKLRAVMRDEGTYFQEWFLDSLKDAFGHIDDLIFISDRHANIKAEISKMFPYATHTICCWHFSKNIKKQYHGKDVVAIMDKAARVYTELKYNRHMEELRNLHQNVYDYVNAADPHKWSRVHCSDRRYRVMTTNTAECIKSCLKFGRQLPMLTLAEFIMNMLQRWFHDRHRAAQSVHN
ncbi:hypothetical protein Ddye_010948 [Dipteronia dyeriana]|uniref:MULE transposase domain-containing protein n=1 Tax=Dipteronia dyeriana TaxID=168575 RepID=A0AAE0CNR7_9ROSI|nr:hypothetical protein Ddye_010948 [Dipteronia dyeriana]